MDGLALIAAVMALFVAFADAAPARGLADAARQLANELRSLRTQVAFDAASIGRHRAPQTPIGAGGGTGRTRSPQQPAPEPPRHSDRAAGAAACGHSCNDAWKSGWVRAGPSGSAAWRWRSAASCWCGIPSSRACSAPAFAWRSARCSRSRSLRPANGSGGPNGPLPIGAVPAAHIPSILTAAGTVSAFGTVYAAHALYQFIGPTLAFLMLGAIGIATMLAAALHGRRCRPRAAARSPCRC